jgi:hypothetical protein
MESNPRLKNSYPLVERFAFEGDIKDISRLLLMCFFNRMISFYSLIRNISTAAVQAFFAAVLGHAWAAVRR